jgi:hypothetical protein
LYGKPINHNKIFKNKKVYSRKNFRVDLWNIYTIRNALSNDTSCIDCPNLYLNLTL